MANPFESLIPKKQDEVEPKVDESKPIDPEANPFDTLIPDFSNKPSPKDKAPKSFEMGDLLDLGKSLAAKSLAFNRGAKQGFLEVAQEGARAIAGVADFALANKERGNDEIARQIGTKIDTQRAGFLSENKDEAGFSEAGRTAGNLATQVGLTAPLGAVGAGVKGAAGVAARLIGSGQSGAALGVLSKGNDDVTEKAIKGHLIGTGIQAGIETIVPGGKLVGKGLKVLSKILGSRVAVADDVLAEASKGAATMQRVRASQQLQNPLTPAEASQRVNLLQQQGKLGVTNKVQGKVDDFFSARDLKSAQNIDDFKNLVHDGKVGDDIASEAHQFADDVLKAERRAVQKEAQPLYEAAERVAVPKAVTEKLSKDPVIADVMEQMKRNPVLLKQLAAHGEGTLGRFDIVKRSIDDQVSAALRAGKANEARVLGDSVKQIRDEMDKISPAYKKARKIFELGSAEVKVLDDSPMGLIAGLKDKQFKTLTNKIFDPAETNAKVLGKIRDRFLAEKPELWYGLTRAHIETKLRAASDATLAKGGVGKLFSKTLLGSPAKREVLFTALEKSPQAKQRMIQLTRLFDSFGTAPTGRASGGSLDVQKSAFTFIGKLLNGRYDAAVADVILDPTWGKKLDTVLRNTSGTKDMKAARLTQFFQQYLTATGTDLGVE